MGARVTLCGIAGEIRFDRSVGNITIIKAMCDAQIHRGPDDEGYYANGPTALGIRRLSIIDLREGLYPLRNEDDTIHLVFNGEVYDFQALRSELEQLGHRFRSKTDAETIVHGYEEWETGCLERLNGMFAFALWDETKQSLWIARDHFGIKPLYYHQNERFFVFASEIKALLKHPELSPHPNRKAIKIYLHNRYVDTDEETFFKGINRLAPAHHFLIQPDGSVNKQRYWTAVVSKKLSGKIHSEEIERTRQLFLEATKKQLVSDVPVGVCLSGGIDSSSVVCAIEKIRHDGAASTGQRIKTFSAVFPGDPVDETDYVKEICKTTEVEYNPIEPTVDDFWRDLPTLVKCQEEPFRGTFVYAQWRVMETVKKHGITVVLGGQGGDELLGGYLHYYANYLLTLKKHRQYPRLLTEGLLSFDLIRSVFKAYLKRLVSSALTHGKSLVLRKPAISWDQAILGCAPTQEIVMPLDDLATLLQMDASSTYLPSLLRYDDKNSMWHSIEARVPFLDRPFFEYVASLPLDRKLRKGWTKYCFRLAMKTILPEKIRLRRSKIGFETPQKKWIEKELRGKIQEFFLQPYLVATEYYNVEALRGLLSKSKLTKDETSLIWRILNLELWYREFFQKDKK